MSEIAELPKSKKVKAGTVISKITVNSKKFMKACEIASKAIDTKSIVPAISNILVRVEDNVIYMIGTNLRQTVSTRLDYNDFITKSLFLFPAALGIRLLSALTDGPVEISHIVSDQKSGDVITKAHSIEITSFGNSYILESENPVDFVTITDLSELTPIVLPRDHIVKGLLYCTSSAFSEYDKNPVMASINFVLNKNLAIIACDGQTLAKYETEIGTSDDETINFLISAKSSALINELNGENVEIRLSENGVQISDDKTSIYSLLLNERYPDTDRIIPKEYTTEITIETSILRSSLNRIGVLSSNSAMTSMDMSELGIEINMIDSNYANEGVELLAIDTFEGNPLKVGINTSNVSKILSKINVGNVFIRGTEPNKALVILPDSEPNLIFLVMPVSI